MSLDAQPPLTASTVETAWRQLKDDTGFQKLHLHVKETMSKYDPSHDFDHVLRVLNMSHYILEQEVNRTRANPQSVYYAALLHDLYDRKYISTSSTGNVTRLLIQCGKDEAWATRIEAITEHVSYKHEVNNPEQAARALADYPELAIVQDADRLDAIGAIGIGRVFTYGGAKAPQRGLQGSVEHFIQKLERLEAMMKTETGKRLARQRTARLQMFREWWEEEMAASGDTAAYVG